MTANVRLMNIAFNQPGYMPPPPMMPGMGVPMGAPGMPPPQPQPGHSATVMLQVDGDHGSQSLSFVVPYNPPNLNALHDAAVQAAQQYFAEIQQKIAQV